MSVILSSKKGVTRRDPLSMIYNGIGILFLIHKLKSEFPGAKQQWFADDESTAGKLHCNFDIVEHHPISPLTAIVVELSSPLLMALSARLEE